MRSGEAAISALCLASAADAQEHASVAVALRARRLAALFALLLVAAPPRRPQDLQSKLEAKQSEAGRSAGTKGVLTTTISRYEDRIDG